MIRVSKVGKFRIWWRLPIEVRNIQGINRKIRIYYLSPGMVASSMTCCKSSFLDFLLIFFQRGWLYFNCFITIRLIFFVCILPLFLCLFFLIGVLRTIHLNRGFCKVNHWIYYIYLSSEEFGNKVQKAFPFTNSNGK